MRKFLAALPLLTLLVVPADLGAKDKHRYDGRNYSDWRRDSNQWRYRDDYMRRGTNSWQHRSQGHLPHDSNGDGVVSRREWLGNGNSFRQLDRNRDGVLSRRDRMLRGNQRYYNDYRYNNYPGWRR